MTHSDRKLIEFTKDSVRQILSPRWSIASLVSASCLGGYFLIGVSSVAKRMTFLPTEPKTLLALNIALLVFSGLFGWFAFRKRFARGKYVGLICLIVSLLLLYRILQPLVL